MGLASSVFSLDVNTVPRSIDIGKADLMRLLFSRPLPPFSLSDRAPDDPGASSDFPSTRRTSQPGDLMRITGLIASSELNGCKVEVLSLGEGRLKVKVHGTGRKVLLREENLEVCEEEEATKGAKVLMERLYWDGRKGAGEKAEGEGDGDAEEELSRADKELMRSLNISILSNGTMYGTGHCDGGAGKFIVTPFNDDDEDLILSAYVRGKRRAKGFKGPALKQALLDHHLQLACVEGNAARIEALVTAGANTSTSRFPGTYHGDNSRMPLHIATYEEHEEVLSLSLPTMAMA